MYLPSAGISALVCGYSAEIRKRKTPIMLTAFIDDSAEERKNGIEVSTARKAALLTKHSGVAPAKRCEVW